MPFYFVPFRDTRQGAGHCRRPSLSLAVTLLSAAAVAALPARAHAETPLTLAEAERLALDAEPGRAAYQARAESLREQAVAAGQLPDPQLRVGVQNFPIEAGGFSTEAMSQLQLGLRQSFPPGDTRAAGARRFESLSAEMSQNVEARGRDVRTAVRKAWFETRYWEDAHAVVSETRPFFADLVTVTRSLYAVGRKDQQDVLLAELELSRLDDRLMTIDEQRAGARATLSEWTGEAAFRPLAATQPSWEQLPTWEQLRAGLDRHPALAAADARIAARRAAVELAEERFKPGWALDLSYGHRDGLLPDGRPRSDFVSVSVTVDLPLFRENRQDRMLRSALSDRRAAEASREQLRRRLLRRLQAEYARWQELDRRVALYEDTILHQAQDSARSALAAYQSDTGDFADVMRGRIDELGVRLDFSRLLSDRAQSYAVLANLGGLPR